jgi:hypothetical protein
LNGQRALAAVADADDSSRSGDSDTDGVEDRDDSDAESAATEESFDGARAALAEAEGDVDGFDANFLNALRDVEAAAAAVPAGDAGDAGDAAPDAPERVGAWIIDDERALPGQFEPNGAVPLFTAQAKAQAERLVERLLEQTQKPTLDAVTPADLFGLLFPGTVQSALVDLCNVALVARKQEKVQQPDMARLVEVYSACLAHRCSPGHLFDLSNWPDGHPCRSLVTDERMTIGRVKELMRAMDIGAGEQLNC